MLTKTEIVSNWNLNRCTRPRTIAKLIKIGPKSGPIWPLQLLKWSINRKVTWFTIWFNLLAKRQLERKQQNFNRKKYFKALIELDAYSKATTYQGGYKVGNTHWVFPVLPSNIELCSSRIAIEQFNLNLIQAILRKIYITFITSFNDILKSARWWKRQCRVV